MPSTELTDAERAVVERIAEADLFFVELSEFADDAAPVLCELESPERGWLEIWRDRTVDRVTYSPAVTFTPWGAFAASVVLRERKLVRKRVTERTRNARIYDGSIVHTGFSVRPIREFRVVNQVVADDAAHWSNPAKPARSPRARKHGREVLMPYFALNEGLLTIAVENGKAVNAIHFANRSVPVTLDRRLG